MLRLVLFLVCALAVDLLLVQTRLTAAALAGPLRVYMPVKPIWSWGRRICGAFHEFAPEWVRWVESADEADVAIVHLDSEADLLDLEPHLRHGTPIVSFQHGLRFADAPIEHFARQGWSKSLTTISFQPLDALYPAGGFDFYHMPWGADRTRFTADGAPAERKPHVVLVGDHTEHETHGELLFAAAHVGVRVRHIAAHPTLCTRCRAEPTSLLCRPLANLGDRAPCDWYDHVGGSDELLLRELRTAAYASALRKFEGFELIGIEALFCGARPLVYDLNDWYKEHAIVVPSGLEAGALFEALQTALRTPAAPVEDDELRALHAAYSWQALVPRMFEHIRRRENVAEKRK